MFRVGIFLPICFSAFAAVGWANISAPGDPRQSSDGPVSAPTEEDAKPLLERQRPPKNKEKPPEEAEKAEEEKKSPKKTNKPADYLFKAEIAMMAPYSTFSDAETKNSGSDPSTHFQVFYGFRNSSQKDALTQWLSLRFASFAGFRSYENQINRFGYLYFGPMFGVGSFRLSLSESESGAELPSFGWMVNGGVSAMQIDQSSGADSSHENRKKTFNVSFDSPGLALEVRCFLFFQELLSAGATAGVQLGDQKYFYYLGLSLSGWH